jgi:hypothetical protein
MRSRCAATQRQEKAWKTCYDLQVLVQAREGLGISLNWYWPGHVSVGPGCSCSLSEKGLSEREGCDRGLLHAGMVIAEVKRPHREHIPAYIWVEA